MSGSVSKTTKSNLPDFAASATSEAGMSTAMAAMQAQSNAGFLQNTELGIQMNLQNQKNEVMESALMGIAKAQL